MGGTRQAASLEEAFMSRRTFRVAVVVVALVATAVPFTQPSATAADAASSHRISAPSDAETAAAVADFAFDSATSAVVTRAGGVGVSEYAPVLAESLDAPVLLSGADSAPPATMDALAALGVSDVVLLGDASALHASVHDQMTSSGFSVSRVTSALEAAELAAGSADVSSAFLVATGSSVEQALGAAAAASSGGVALEVTPGSLAAPVAAFLSSRGVDRAVMVGEAGKRPAGETLASALREIGVQPVPLFGRDIYELSVALEETSYRDPSSAVLANPDSVTEVVLASSLGAVRDAPALLVPSAPPLPAFVEGALSAHANALTELVVIGDTAAITDEQVDAATAATLPIGILDVDDVETGMLGTAYTVVRGIDPVSFDVEVLGVIEGGIAPGIPMILVQTSGPVIEETGGIAAGFSGSPVYVEVEGRRTLLGAIAYGCFACDQTIGGVTPADAMIDVLSYPNGQTSAQFRPAAQPGSVEVGSGSGSMELRRLDLPVAFGGLGQERFDRVASDLERTGARVTPYRSSSGAAPTFAPFDPLFPGHSYAGVLATGTLSFAGVGTTTYRDGDRSLAFGHPFFWSGRSGLGLSAAHVHFVWSDPSNLFGGFKVASVTGEHGIMDQDRIAAVAGTEGTFPHFAEVPVSLDNLSTGRSFGFRTRAVEHRWFPDIAAITLLTSIDRSLDRIGDGSSALEWTIAGRDSSGDPFELTLGDRFASQWDIAWTSIFDLWFQLYAIQENEFERVTFDRVSVDGEVTDDLLLREVVSMRARTTSFRRWISEGRLRVRPGDTIEIEAALKRPRGDTIVQRMGIVVPRRADGRGRLQVRGGGSSYDDFFFFDGGGGGGNVDSLEGLLEKLSRRTRNDTLIATLDTDKFRRRRGIPEPSSHGRRGRLRRRAVQQLDEVIFGSEALRVVVVR